MQDFKFGPELQSKGQKMKRHKNKGGKRTPRLGKTETLAFVHKLVIVPRFRIEMLD